MSASEDRLAAASQKLIVWSRSVEAHDDIPPALLRSSVLSCAKLQVFCRAAAREKVFTIVAYETGRGNVWQPRGESVAVCTSGSDLLAALESRAETFEAMRRAQQTRCGGCGGQYATGAVVWETERGYLYCERCYRVKQATGATLRAYCRAADFGEKASSKARGQLKRAVEQVLAYEASLAKVFGGPAVAVVRAGPHE